MRAVIPSVLAADGFAAAMMAESLPRTGEPVELRADLLDQEEIRAVVGPADRDWIVTVRRTSDGGFFEGQEEDRAALLRAALEAGARWVDVELGSGLADWADGTDASRTILSHHGGRCELEVLRETYARLAATRADRLKLVACPDNAAQVFAIREILHEAGDPRLCAFGLGRAGVASRLLALAWGSWGTYAAPLRGAETAPGQFTVGDLERIYEVRTIDADTTLFALVGGAHILPGSPSPAMHNAGYRALELPRRYLPLPCDSWAEVESVASGLRLAGLAVTMPFKANAAGASVALDRVAEQSAAANTLLFETGGIRGANTDGPAALELLRAHGLMEGDGIDVIGGGGTGRAIAVTLAAAGFHPTIWRRETQDDDPAPEGVAEGLLETRRPGASEWLINATPRRDAGPFCGGVPARKGVLDAVYGPDTTALVAAGRAAGLAAIDGFALLVAQAELQFRLQTGADAPTGLFAECGQRYLASLG